MGIDEIQQAMLKTHGLRITPAMAEYIANNLQQSNSSELPIIAGDARTGVPLRTMIPLDQLRASTQAAQ